MYDGVFALFALKPRRNIAKARPLASYIVESDRHEESLPIIRSGTAGALPGALPRTPPGEIP
jgi:hypothetical protein